VLGDGTEVCRVVIYGGDSAHEKISLLVVEPINERYVQCSCSLREKLGYLQGPKRSESCVRHQLQERRSSQRIFLRTLRQKSFRLNMLPSIHNCVQSTLHYTSPRQPVQSQAVAVAVDQAVQAC